MGLPMEYSRMRNFPVRAARCWRRHQLLGEDGGVPTVRPMGHRCFDLREGEAGCGLAAGREIEQLAGRTLELPTLRRGFDGEPPPARLDDGAQPAALVGGRMVDHHELTGEAPAFVARVGLVLEADTLDPRPGLGVHRLERHDGRRIELQVVDLRDGLPSDLQRSPAGPIGGVERRLDRELVLAGAEA
jgi:hypothetical protein